MNLKFSRGWLGRKIVEVALSFSLPLPNFWELLPLNVLTPTITHTHYKEKSDGINNKKKKGLLVIFFDKNENVPLNIIDYISQRVKRLVTV